MTREGRCRRNWGRLGALLALALALGLPPAAPAQAQEAGEHTVVVYFFWGDGCPHCAAAKPFLEDLVRRYPAELRAYEVWYVPENRELFTAMAAVHGFEPSAVPTIFIGEWNWIGFHESMQDELESAVRYCAQAGCPDLGQGVIPGIPTATALPPPSPAPTATAQATPLPAPTEARATPAAAATKVAAVPATAADTLDLPFFGPVNLGSQSLLVSTSLIALVDGFNPCSIWVLSLLMALVIHTGSRAKTIVIGLVFLTVTAGVYALFIAGLFTALSLASYLLWIQGAVALVALFFGAVNVKDYFWYRQGVSFTIGDEHKPGLYRRGRQVVAASGSLWGLVSATTVMAAGASLVEFSCTAGFPLLWTNLLSAQGVDGLTFALLLGVYLLIYQADELVIFFSVVFSMKASRLEEKHGRLLKLIGGSLMLALAFAMLVEPAWMNALGSSLVIFGAALGAALLILFLHTRVLPRFGIVIGSQLAPDQGRRAAKRR